MIYTFFIVKTIILQYKYIFRYIHLNKKKMNITNWNFINKATKKA